jgi:uncharacterized protein
MDMGTLSREESLRLLAGVPVGRLVFTVRDRPVIRPVNFAIDDGAVVIRTSPGSKLTAAVLNVLVAFQADEIDPVARTGWSVSVTGRASVVQDPAAQARLRELVTPWAPGDKEHFLRIVPELVSGVRLTPQEMLTPT